MWILPKQLHTSVYAVGTEALISDLNEQFQACEQSLTARSTHLPVRTWLRKWKKDTWTQHLSGRILKHSHGKAFVEKWTSCLEDTLASRLVRQDQEKDKKTSDTCGHLLQKEFEFPDQQYVSLKMSLGIFRWDSPQSSAIWKKWVTKCHGEYSQRLKLVHHTKEKECLFLPTPCANEDSFRLNGTSQQSKCLEARARRGELTTAGFVRNVERISLLAANAIIMNLSVLNVENGLTHLHGNHTMDAQHVGPSGQHGITSKLGPLNPQFVETMMGVPIGWTDCDC